MLLALRDYIKAHHVVSLDELTRVFSSQASAIEGMLEIWMRKGDIKCYTPTQNCQKSCLGCGLKKHLMVEFIEN